MNKNKNFMALVFSLMMVLVILVCAGCGSSNDNNANKLKETRVADSNKETKSDVGAKENKTEPLIEDSNKSERAVLGEDFTITKEGEIPKTNVTKRINKNNITLVIDKSEYVLDVVKNGQVLNEYSIAVGKNPGQKQKSGDLKTPTGNFYVEEIINAKAWTHDFHDGKGVINGAYGPWFLSLNTGGWDGIGIHGTHDDSSIGKMVSEGCIRMHNKDVAELKKIVNVGTEVVIKE